MIGFMTAALAQQMEGDSRTLPTVGGIRLETSLADLKSKHPSLYSHRLAGGEVLHEACNQKTLHAFAFTEQPWAPGVVGEVSVSVVAEEVCRDKAGQLPDLNLSPGTDRNIRLGDSEQAILKTYGTPNDRTVLQSGQIRVTYRVPSKRPARLVFMLVGNKLNSISACYDPPVLR